MTEGSKDDLSSHLVVEEDALWRTFLEICAFGGRFCGTDGERRAAHFLEDRLRAAGLAEVERREVDYVGWRCDECRLELPERPGWTARVLPLVYSSATPKDGLVLEAVDLGRGAPEDFSRRRKDIAGRAVILDTEYSFSAGSIHRRQKFLSALEAGAAALVIVNPRGGGVPATGSTRPEGSEIPAVGISKEDGAMVREMAGRPEGRIRLSLQTETTPARAANLFGRIFGGDGRERVILCAHYDGHNCGESAIDNASGTAVALELARLLSVRTRSFSRDFEVHFYSVEEWGLQGSRAYADSLSEDEAGRIALAINLDVVAGSEHLTWLCNGFTDLAGWVQGALGEEPPRCAVSERVAINSDHANYVRRGIPALRLLAGMDEPESRCGYHLSPADTSDKVDLPELAAAASVTSQLLLKALNHPGPIARHKTPDEVSRLLSFTYGFGPAPR